MSATFLPVLVVASILALSVYLDLYNSVYVELGFEHYAEKANSTLGGYKFPVWMKMPANTLVNVGYVGVGFLWLLRVTSSDKLHETDIATNLYMVSIFAWMAIIYGFTQFARIVTQSLFWAVLDQWFTLPFFCWTIIWSRTVQHGWKAQSAVLILVLSILSYNLALLHKFGFDVALGVHIAVAFWYGCKVLQLHFSHDNLILFLLVLLNCSGFVFLKLGDFHFAKYKIFQDFTGHFWSKICDFLQIHFVITFFLNISQKPGSVKKVR